MGLDGMLVGSDDEEYERQWKPFLNRTLDEARKTGISLNGFQLGALNGEEYIERIGRYSGLQMLRSYAAYIAVHGRPPAETAEDSINAELNAMYNRERGFEPFQHLINHSDADGIYLPIDFAKPFLYEAPCFDGEGTWECDVGSSPALLRELNQINQHLQMPGDWGELGGWEAVEKLCEGPFGNERWVWSVMRYLARVSAEKNLLFVFC